METITVDLSTYKNPLGKKNQVKRLLWTLVWTVFARPIPRSLFNAWKLFLLRCFGADVHPTAVVYSSAHIYAPWNLQMAAYACLGAEVNCYSVDKISIGAHSTISQNVHLCTASHNIASRHHTLVTAPIVIEDQVWVATDAFIGMGVTLQQGAVVAARACVSKTVLRWTVVGGNPAKWIKDRIIKD